MADWYKASLAGGHDVSESTTSTSPPNLKFTSRRSPVLCRHGCVASSQTAASMIGVQILQSGGNAADAAVAVAAALAVTEPCSTGLGGDMFCLYYDAATKNVSCVNGSGRSPAKLDLQLLKEKYGTETKQVDKDAFSLSPHAVTVPGAAQGWQDVIDRHGTMTLAQVLEPAALLAEQGFPVAPITAHHWQAGMSQITQWCTDDQSTVPLSIKDEETGQQRGPRAGEIFRNTDMARVLRELGKYGAKEGFYNGATGKAIVDCIQHHGGCMEQSDLSDHRSDFPQPIFVEYRGFKLWQHPPNGQGIAGLIALAGLQDLENSGMVQPISSESLGSAEAYHAMIEMMRLGFADAREHVADADCMAADVNTFLLDPTRIRERAIRLFDKGRAHVAGTPDASSCTVSFQVVDCHGNAVSFVNSNFMGFGTGLVPQNCGFTLQNRGFGFSVEEGHVNCVGPSKRPFHTIIPGMLTHADTDELYATISNMGGNMQPQGHLQLTVGLIAAGLDPQAAIDMPRFCIADGTQNGVVYLEDGISEEVTEELERRGHQLKTNVEGHDRSLFGRAQIIKRDRTTGVLWAGSDGRADGCATGY